MTTATREKVAYKVPCNLCGKFTTIEMYPEDVEELNSPNRRHIQDIFPYLNPDERELLISRTCPVCWDKMFNLPEPDEEEEYDEEEYESCELTEEERKVLNEILNR